MLMRDHGGILFATIRDWSGDLQVMLVGGTAVDEWDNAIDIGDHVGVAGEVITTKTGELSVEATSGSSPPSACGRCRTSTGAWPTRRPGSASATSTW